MYRFNNMESIPTGTCKSDLFKQGSLYTGGVYSSPSILQPSILRPPLIIRHLDFCTRGQFSVLNDPYFKTTYNIRPHFLGPMGGLKVEGLLYVHYTVNGTDYL